MTIRFRLLLAMLFVLPANQAFQASPPATDHLLDPFAPGWMLSDTNGDGIVDYVSVSYTHLTLPTIYSV